ncbi:MAG TPA: ABC transporter permease [Terriglobales bacterium]|nr:ABC transporter permease [Terriglobales bacterium]
MQNVSYAIRGLRKSPGFTVVAVLTLALGIGANTAIFSVVQAVLLRPLPYPEPDQLVKIWNSYPPFPPGGLSPGDYADWRAQAKSFSGIGAYAEISTGFNLTGNTEPQRVQAGYASASLFPLLGVAPVAGRGFSPEDDRAGGPPVVMLSHRLWQSRFGSDPNVVGQSVTLDDHRYSVIGILPAGFDLVRWADLWLSFGQYYDDLTSHVHHDFIAVARLKPGVTLSQARDEITRLNQQEAISFPAEHKGFGVIVQQLEDASAVRLRSTLLILLGAVGLVLLIACLNIVNLLLVRNAAREREIAVRTALGASPRSLLGQMLTESLLLALLGAGAGLIFAVLILKGTMPFVSADLTVLRSASLNGTVFAFTAAVTLLTALACGLLPALRTLRINLVGNLKQGSKGTSGPGRHRSHNLVAVAEIGMALVLLTGAGLLLRSFQHLLEVDPGFRTDHILMMEVPHAALPFTELIHLSEQQENELTQKQFLEFEQITEELRALPGIKDAGGISELPLDTELRSASRFLIEGRPSLAVGVRPIAQTRGISPSYFSTLGIPLLAGRGFTKDHWEPGNILINETMARRYWPQGDELGKRINMCSLSSTPCWFSIVGVVGNVHQFGLDGDPTCDVYFTSRWPEHLLIRTASDPASIVKSATDVIHRVDANLPVTHVQTMDDLLSDSLSSRRVSAELVGIFAALALILAAVGIYGVLSYTVSQRTQEIGIRMAIGAQRGDVQRMILGHTLRLALAGVGFGLTVSVALAHFLKALLFGVAPYDPATLLCVTVLLLLIALAAAYEPARRALRVDPLIAFRSE